MENGKKNLRREMKTALLNMSDSRRREEEQKVFEELKKLSAWKDSTNILVFLSMKSEFSTEKIFLEARKLSRKIWSPRMYGDIMKFHLLWTPENRGASDSPQAQASMDAPVPPEEFEPEDYPLDYNPYGIWEPSTGLPVFPGEKEKSEKTLVITPGLAFDRRGNRLGRGKGYYDRWFSRIREVMAPSLITAVGIGYSIQMAESVPHGENDIPLPLLILGGEVIYCR